MTTEEKIERRNKIIVGLAIAYERMLEFKRQKGTEIVIIRENKIIRVKP
jgi:hypothetical protein